MLNKLMIGRLGNQMFQYATMRAIQLKYYPNETLNLNFTLVYKEGPKKNGFKNQLTNFNLAPHVVDKKIKLSLIQKMLFAKYFITYKAIKPFYHKDWETKKRKYEIEQQNQLQKHGLFIFNFGFYQFIKSTYKNKLFIGFYESAKYFDEIKPILQKEFTPKKPERPENKKLYQAIRNSNSVCVSIRRGDFLAPEHIKQNYICTPEYFKKAIKLAQNKLENPRFIIFSDDINWVKNNINFPKETLFESGEDPVWEKLRLMYSCNHFIISNSTFSWWAQYLSKNNTDKLVIAPKKWKNVGYNNDIYQENWITI